MEEATLLPTVVNERTASRSSKASATFGQQLSASSGTPKRDEDASAGSDEDLEEDVKAATSTKEAITGHGSPSKMQGTDDGQQPITQKLKLKTAEQLNAHGETANAPVRSHHDDMPRQSTLLPSPPVPTSSPSKRDRSEVDGDASNLVQNKVIPPSPRCTH